MRAAAVVALLLCSLSVFGVVAQQNDRLHLLWDNTFAYPIGFELKSGTNASLVGASPPFLENITNVPPGPTEAVRFGSDGLGGNADNYFRLDNPRSQLYSPQISVIMWIDRIGSNARAVLAHASASFRGWQVSFNGQNLQVSIGNGVAFSTVSVGVPQTWNDWATIIITIDSSGVTLVDTTCQSVFVPAPATMVPAPDPTPLTLGQDVLGSTLIFNGWFGPVLIYDVALDASITNQACNNFTYIQQLTIPPTPSMTPSNSPSNSGTPSNTPTISLTPTETPSNSPTPSETSSMSPTTTATVSPSPSVSPSVSAPSTARPTQRPLGPLVVEVVEPVDGGELTITPGGNLPNFLISFGLREVTPDGQTVVDVSPQEMPAPDEFRERENRLPNYYRLSRGPVAKAPPAVIDQEAEYFVVQSTVQFGDRQVVVPELSYKFVVSIYDWPFQSTDNQLWLIIATSSSAAEQCEGTLDETGDDNRLTLVFSDGTLFSANFFRFGLRDGNPVLVTLTNELIARDRVAIQMPFFNSSMFLDPSFQVLVDGEFVEQDTRCGSGGKDKNNLLPLQIALPIAVVCCLCCCLPVIVVVLLVLAKFGVFKRVFLAGDEMDGGASTAGVDSQADSPTD